MTLKKMRELFSLPIGDEDHIPRMVHKILSEIDTKKSGTMIGKKKPTNYSSLLNTKFPERGFAEEKLIQEVVGLYNGVGNWLSPQMQVNVVPPPTNISIAAATVAARFNENTIWDHYSHAASQAEVKAIGMIGNLIGYPKPSGIFTFGGTGCLLYAIRIGIEKADPHAKEKGIHSKMKIFTSDLAHYAATTAAIWTGIGSDNVVAVPTNERNQMDTKALEQEMNKALKDGYKIAGIIATMGTTDAFGIDPLKEIVAIRNKVQKKAKHPIHIHADAVIGWPYLCFKRSSMLSRLTERLKNEVKFITNQVKDVKLADSVGIDFHKTGWAPYLCSAFVIKDVKDFALLKKGKKEMPYLYHDDGYQPGIFSLESSRPNYALKALVNILAFGKEGYEILILNLLSVADYFRDKLDNSDEFTVVNRANPAFVTDFRVYPKEKMLKGKDIFTEELHDNMSEAYTKKLNEYNHRVAQRMIENAEKKGTSMISYTDSYRTTKKGRHLVALKSYPMSPYTERYHMDILFKDLYVAKKEVDRKFKF